VAVKIPITFKEKLKHSWWHWYDDAWVSLNKGEWQGHLGSQQCACCEFLSSDNTPCKTKISNCPISTMSGIEYCENTPYQSECSHELEDVEMELMYFQLCYYWHGFKGEIWQ